MAEFDWSQYALSELKLVYTTLHAQLTLQPELMDSKLMEDLQAHLQQAAKADGVDASTHSQWAAWLNDR
ncbi:MULTISPECIES: hypothetical protein [unclassified Thioalkalivibrio]|uniref:hypothetical protein n=1 Tax=unclassified Thioalkalivibrio TaxID=2621013 RepID=UPI00037733C5|nr:MULTISPECIES: hypothetical protein [unclassified Thioalkalivibrio]